MIKKYFPLLLIVVFLVNVSVTESSESEDGFSFLIKPMYMMVEGLPTKVGDVYKCCQKFASNFEYSAGVAHYEMTYREINPTLKPKISAQVGIGYQKDRGKIAVSGWFFEADSSISGNLTSQKKDQYNFCINGVSMFGRIWIPIQNDLEPSGYAPVSYWGKNEIRVAIMNTAYGYSIIKTPKWVTNVLVGMKGGHFKITKEGGKQQVGWLNNYFATDTHRLTRHELANKKELKIFVVGPEVKSESMLKFKNIELRFGISHGILLGTAKNEGDFGEVYEVCKAITPAYYEPYFYYKRMFPVSKKERIALPVTEGEIAFNLTILRTEKVSVLGGIILFASIWRKIPNVLEWTMPNDYPLGSGWKETGKNNYEFYAVIANIDLNF